jgi:hypothetical protein
MRLFRLTLALACIFALAPRAMAIPIGDNTEYFPGKVQVEDSLEVGGTLKFTSGFPDDGSADNVKDGYVLTTDEFGNATWQPPTVASTDFTDTSLIGTTSFEAAAGESSAIVTGDITFDNVDVDNQNAILYKAVLENPTITGDLTSMEYLDVATQLSVTGQTDLADVSADSISVTGAVSADSLSGSLAGDQITGEITVATISGDKVSSKVDEAATADKAMTLDANATINANQISGVIDADGLASDAEIDIVKTTTDILALDPSAKETIITASPTLEVGNSIVRIEGDPTMGPSTTSLTTITATAGNALKDGQFLILRGMSDSFKVRVETGGNIVLNSGIHFIMGDFDTLTLIYDANVSKWIETSRTDIM